MQVSADLAHGGLLSASSQDVSGGNVGFLTGISERCLAHSREHLLND